MISPSNPWAPDGSRVVVLETRRRWEAALRRGLPRVEIRACRLAGEARRLVEEHPGAVLLLDWQIGLAECVTLLGELAVRRAEVTTILAGALEISDLEWYFRELGVLEFLPAPRDADVVELCRRCSLPRGTVSRPGISAL